MIPLVFPNYYKKSKGNFQTRLLEFQHSIFCQKSAMILMIRTNNIHNYVHRQKKNELSNIKKPIGTFLNSLRIEKVQLNFAQLKYS